MSPEAQKNKAMARDSQKAGEKPKVPPERECWHRTIFSIVCYACLVALLITGIPRLKTMFTPRGQSVCASPLLEKMSQLLDTAVVVRQDGHAPSASSTSYYRYTYTVGGQWYSLLTPILLILALTLVIKDKKLACRAQYGMAWIMGAGLILGCGVFLLEIFKQTTDGMG